MFSFMKIATFAALAFGTFASALPTSAPVSDAGAVESHGPKDVATVMNNLHGSLQSPCSQLDGLTPETATLDVVQEIVLEIQGLLNPLGLHTL